MKALFKKATIQGATAVLTFEVRIDADGFLDLLGMTKKPVNIKVADPQRPMLIEEDGQR